MHVEHELGDLFPCELLTLDTSQRQRLDAWLTANGLHTVFDTTETPGWHIVTFSNRLLIDPYHGLINGDVDFFIGRQWEGGNGVAVGDLAYYVERVMLPYVKGFGVRYMERVSRVLADRLQKGNRR